MISSDNTFLLIALSSTLSVDLFFFENVSFTNLDEALLTPDTQLRLFGKPMVNGQRRMGVALARADSIESAREKANQVVSKVNVSL